MKQIKELRDETGKLLAKYNGVKFTVREDAALFQEVEGFLVTQHPKIGKEVEVELIKEIQEKEDDELENFE